MGYKSRDTKFIGSKDFHSFLATLLFRRSFSFLFPLFLKQNTHMDSAYDKEATTLSKPSSEIPEKTPTAVANSYDEAKPVTAADNDSRGSTRKEEVCVICLNPVESSSRGVAGGCLHACFHFGCLATWFEESRSKRRCPLCKNSVEFIKYGFEVGSTKFRKFYVGPEKPDKQPPRRHRRVRESPLSESQSSIPPPSSSSSSSSSILRRRYIYKHRLRSLHIGTNRRSRFMNFTPKNVREQTELQSKAKAWIRRELEVFEWTERNREWLLDYLLSVVKSVDLKAADGTAEKLVAEFFGEEFAGVFVHELHAYLRSPFVRVQDFDNWAQYAKPEDNPATVEPINDRVAR